jgi:hypothetical protein
MNEEEERERISNLHSIFRMLFDNVWGDPFMPIDDKIEAVDKLTRDFREKVTGGDEYSDEDNLAQEETMSDVNPTADEMVDETEVVEEAKVELSPEEFEALKAKADTAETYAEEIQRLEEERKAQEAEQREAALRDVAESYTALPVEIDEFVANMTALEASDPERAGWFKTQFAAFDKALEEAGLLEEHGTDQEGEGDPGVAFLQIVDAKLKDEFGGDPAKYPDALLAASAENPELAQAYNA